MQVILKKLVDRVGIADTLEIVRRWGGGTLYVPRNVRPCDPLALTLGLESARRFVQHFGGDYLELPHERKALIDMRNAAIIADYRAGVSLSEIGRSYGVSRQSAADIVRNKEQLTAVRQKFAGIQPATK